MIKLSSASLSGKEIQAVVDVLKDNFFGMGKKVQEFEEALSVFFNQDVVCVVGGKGALEVLGVDMCIPVHKWGSAMDGKKRPRPRNVV